ncbi:MAG: hypothetical protein ACI4QD_05435 [Kiritimatiellia bacterium]
MKGNILLASLAFASLAWAVQPRLAVLSKSGAHRDEWDSGLDELKWTADAIDSEEKLAALESRLEQYDMLLVAPLFGGKVGNPEAYLTFLRDGGMIVVTDGRYQSVRDWMRSISEDFSGVAIPNGDCNSSQWFVNGYVQDAKPSAPHPLRTFPKRIHEPNHWGHFGESSNPKWELLARCSEGRPVVWLQRVGKGHIIYSALRQYTAAHLLNWAAWQRLSRAGIELKQFEMSPRELGNGMMRLSYAKLATPVPIELGVTPGRTFKGVLGGTTGSLAYRLDRRGEQRLTLKVGGQTIFEEMVRLPFELEVQPPMGRRSLSTETRGSQVWFPVDLAPLEESFAGRWLEIAIFDSKGKALGEGQISRVGKDLHPVVPFRTDRPLAPGRYQVVVKMPRRAGRGEPYAATNRFDVLAPRRAQTIVDQDGTLLVAGKPFFPLGFYHVGNEDLAQVAELGANTVQFWAWQGRTGMDRVKELGLKALFENNHGSLAAYSHRLADYKDHEALLMWYIADEPTDCNALACRTRNDFLLANDWQHPTYILSCRPDLFNWASRFGEVLAFDSYGKIPETAARATQAAEATRDRVPVIAVLPSWGNPNGQKSNPEFLRQRAFLALASGVRGIFWYPWKQAGGGPLGEGLVQAPQDWPAYQSLIAEIKTLEPDLTAFFRQRLQYGDIYALHCRRSDGRNALIYANASDKPAATDLRLPGKNAPRRLALKPRACGVLRW